MASSVEAVGQASSGAILVDDGVVDEGLEHAGAVPGPENGVVIGPGRALAGALMAGPARPTCPVWLDFVVVIATSAVLSFGGIGLLLADMGHYSAGLVFPIGIVGTAAAVALARPRAQERARRRRRSWSMTALGACLVALGQLAWNATNMSRHVVGDRDPGVYVLIGKWLAGHGSLVVPATSLWSGTAAKFSMNSAGVYRMPNGTLQFQFAHMMSVLLAEADNLGGDSLMFMVPAVLGAIGLCAIYVVGCRLVRRPWLVLAAVAGFALSLPELNVTRDAYSEPATQVLLWGGVFLLLRAYETRSGGMAFVAGLAIGGTLMTHIDAVIYLAPLPLFAALGWLTARDRRDRKSLAPVIAFGLLGVIPTAVLGTIDVLVRSGQYYENLTPQMHSLYRLVKLTAILAVVVVVAWTASPAIARRFSSWMAGHRRLLSDVASWSVGIGLLVAWALRPAKLVGGLNAPVSAVVTQLQVSLGLPAQPGRTYAEQSLRWFEWYIGPIAVALGIIGLCVLVTMAIRSGSVAATVLLAIVGGIAALYLWDPSNTPDQVWVTRRYVTGALPLFALGAALALDVGVTALARLAEGKAWAKRVVVVGTAGLVAFPIGALWPVRDFHSQANFLQTVQDVCKVLGPHAAVTFPAGDFDAVTLPITLQDWCHVPTAVLEKSQPKQEVVRVAEAFRRQGRVLWVLGSSTTAISRSVPGLSPTLLGRAVSNEELAKTLEGPPEHYATAVLTIYGAKVL
jgi:hypothetical protein